MDWKCGSSGTAPALPAQSPEFKPQTQVLQKKKKEIQGKQPINSTCLSLVQQKSHSNLQH
jgi:hypothetical protein